MPNQLATDAWSGVIFPDVASQLIIRVGAREAPVTAALLKMGRKSETMVPELNWYTADPGARRTQVNNVGGYGTGDTSIVVDDASIFAVGDIVKVEPTGEVILVTAVDTGTDTLTVVRSIGSTAAATMSDDDWFYNMGPAKEEGSTGADSRNTSNVKKTSYTQIFERTLELTRTAENSKSATGNTRDEERRKKLIEVSRDIELACMFGEAGEETATTGKPRRFTMGVHEIAAANVADANGTLTKLEFQDWASQVFMYGSDYRLAVGGSTAVGIVLSLFEGSQFVAPGDSEVGFSFTRVRVPGGTMDIVQHPLMLGEYDTEITAIDPEEAAMRFFTGADLKLYENVKEQDIDGRKDKYLGELGFTWGNPSTHGRLTNITAAG